MEKCCDLSLAWGSVGVSLASFSQVFPVCMGHDHLLAPVPRARGKCVLFSWKQGGVVKRNLL